MWMEPPPRPKPRRPFYGPDFPNAYFSKPKDDKEDAIVPKIRSLYHSIAKGPKILESSTRFVMIYMCPKPEAVRHKDHVIGIISEWFDLDTPISHIKTYVGAVAKEFSKGPSSFKLVDRNDKTSPTVRCVDDELLRRVPERAKERARRRREENPFHGEIRDSKTRIELNASPL